MTQEFTANRLILQDELSLTLLRNYIGHIQEESVNKITEV